MTRQPAEQLIRKLYECIEIMKDGSFARYELEFISVALKKMLEKTEEVLKGSCDSFVVETDVHYPTDTNLLFDAIRKMQTNSKRYNEKQPKILSSLPKRGFFE